jgi:hypothetical protein
MTTDKDDNPGIGNGASASRKKPYTKPELVVHGAVDRITENSQGSGSKYDLSQNIAQRSK